MAIFSKHLIPLLGTDNRRANTIHNLKFPEVKGHWWLITALKDKVTLSRKQPKQYPALNPPKKLFQNDHWWKNIHWWIGLTKAWPTAILPQWKHTYMCQLHSHELILISRDIVGNLTLSFQRNAIDHADQGFKIPLSVFAACWKTLLPLKKQQT